MSVAEDRLKVSAPTYSTERVGNERVGYSEHIAATEETRDELTALDVHELAKRFLSREPCFNKKCNAPKRRVTVRDEVVTTTGLTGPTGFVGIRIETECPACCDRHVAVVSQRDIDKHDLPLLIVARQRMDATDAKH